MAALRYRRFPRRPGTRRWPGEPDRQGRRRALAKSGTCLGPKRRTPYRVVAGEGEHLVPGQPHGGTGVAQQLVPRPRIEQRLIGVRIVIRPRSGTDQVARAHPRFALGPAAVSVHMRARAGSILKFHGARLSSPNAQFLRRRVAPRYLATDFALSGGRRTRVRSVCSAQSLQRCLAVHRFVRLCEPAEVGEPPAVRDGGDGAVRGICRP
jgi:hypothetical protein